MIAYYTRDGGVTSQTFVITSDKFAGTYKLVGKTVLRNAESGLDEAFQIVIPNLKWTSNLELGFSAEGNPEFNTEFGTENYGKGLVDLVEFGHGKSGHLYDYPSSKNFADLRPFVQNTHEDLKKNKQHVEALKSGFKKEGIKIK